MPLYDYQCKKCQSAFEVRATFKEKEAGLEPECRNVSMEVRHVYQEFRVDGSCLRRMDRAGMGVD